MELVRGGMVKHHDTTEQHVCPTHELSWVVFGKSMSYNMSNTCDKQELCLFRIRKVWRQNERNLQHIVGPEAMDLSNCIVQNCFAHWGSRGECAQVSTHGATRDICSY